MSAPADYTQWRISRCEGCHRLTKVYHRNGECEACDHQHAPGQR